MICYLEAGTFGESDGMMPDKDGLPPGGEVGPSDPENVDEDMGLPLALEFPLKKASLLAGE